ncbi:hypothetical protein [Psychrobacillus sp. FSL K6-1267]|uniref:hypothetical protein n=1 Tax=Psychrobacillus sp. FSL K6-1267 TaxID=2921543 RepID=UPI0011A50C59|nr:hypothetical protein GI482_09605 [Bacillus sp. N3536]
MSECPLCNAFNHLEQNCPKCTNPLEDAGKESDFFDPYAHYNDLNTIKMGDGYPDTYKDDTCPHLIMCNNCGYDEVKFIQGI